MSFAYIYSNLRAFKRSAKELPETARSIAWYMKRRYSGNKGLIRSDEWKAPNMTSFQMRPFQASSNSYEVSVVSPCDGHYMTTFFDVPTVSPSGRFLAVTKVPFIDRTPLPGDLAEVCIIDLERSEVETVYQTAGWGAQLGANVQWGDDDDTIFCNDLCEGVGRGVRISRRDRSATYLEGPIYGLTPDRKYSYSGNIHLVNALIPGYGVPDSPFRRSVQLSKVSSTEGIWKTNLQTGAAELLISIESLTQDLVSQDYVRGGTYHVFNTKVSPCGTKLFTVLFSKEVPGKLGKFVQLVTMNIDGSNPKVAVTAEMWSKGGHHPSWTPSGDRILMNLRYPARKMAFVSFKADGSDMRVIADGHQGSGHPSLNRNERFLLTDSYISEGFIDTSGKVPIRLIDINSNIEEEVCRVYTNRLDGPRRVDPHPVWCSDGRSFIFNGVVNGFRQVMRCSIKSEMPE